jgi:hypothetical protein
MGSIHGRVCQRWDSKQRRRLNILVRTTSMKKQMHKEWSGELSSGKKRHNIQYGKTGMLIS